jgi:hypothetical protein
MDDFFAFVLVCFASGIMLITLYAYFKAVRRRFNQPKEIPGEAEERLMQRLDLLENRISDSQEVLLSLDEKMAVLQLPAYQEPNRALQE